MFPARVAAGVEEIDNASMSSKSTKSNKEGSRFTEPIHPIKSSPPIKLNLVGRAKSLTGSGREGSSIGGTGDVVRSSGESHVSVGSDKSGEGSGKEKKDKVVFGPPKKLNLQRRKSEVMMRRPGTGTDEAFVVPGGDSRPAEVNLKSMMPGGGLGKLSRSLSVTVTLLPSFPCTSYLS
ncbi:hypothetical protein BC830DRAFT_1156089 [Chytriomyces sp. MP71]|nr:hypothetical protein BC830DRAFT_1156089 [Chytriomyces sp. MP71]